MTPEIGDYLAKARHALEVRTQIRLDYPSLLKKSEHIAAAFGKTEVTAAYQNLSHVDAGLARPQDVQHGDVLTVLIHQEGGRIVIVLLTDAFQATLDNDCFFSKQIIGH